MTDTTDDFLLRRGEGTQVKIHKEVYERLTMYCLRNGMVRTAAASLAVHEWLKKRESSGEN